MRITGGRLKGRILASPKGRGIRPSAGLLREAVFSILGQDLAGRRVLDLFAGAGALAFEALSRGADFALMVDGSSKAVALMRRNVQSLGLETQARVLRWDLRRGLPPEPILQALGPFDLVFVDPPYRKGLAAKVLEHLGAAPEGFRNAKVVLESDKREVPPEGIGRLRLCGSRLFGDTRLSIFTSGESDI